MLYQLVSRLTDVLVGCQIHHQREQLAYEQGAVGLSENIIMIEHMINDILRVRRLRVKRLRVKRDQNKN